MRADLTDRAIDGQAVSTPAPAPLAASGGAGRPAAFCRGAGERTSSPARSTAGLPETVRFRADGAPVADPFAVLDDLAANCTDPAVFMEPWMLAPALRHLAPATGGVDVTLLRHDGELVGALPLARARPRAMPAAAVASVWVHPYCYDSTPLVRAGCEARVLEALFARLEADGASVLRWPMLPLDTRFAEALLNRLAAEGQPHAVLAANPRPLLDCRGRTADAFLAETMSSKSRRELARLRRRLAELGEVRVVRADAATDGADLARAFIGMEASGWKGRRGRSGALAGRRAADRDWFVDVMRDGVSGGGLAIYTLEVDGRPAAMSVNAVSGGAMWGLRTAYDAALAARGPGVLVETDQALAALDDAATAWIDACTDVVNPLLERLYPERRRVADLVVATSPQAGRALALAAGAEAGYRRARGLAKRLYYTLRRP